MKNDLISRQDAVRVVSGLDSSFVKYIEELPSAKPEPLTEAEIIICKLYLDDLDKYKTCNEYKLLMGLLDGTASAQPEPCEDCVSRKAAIRLLHSGYHSKSMIEEVKELPSVQPEIIVCADCKHWICHDRRCGYWNHGVKPLEWCCHAERRTNE